MKPSASYFSFLKVYKLFSAMSVMSKPTSEKNLPMISDGGVHIPKKYSNVGPSKVQEIVVKRQRKE